MTVAFTVDHPNPTALRALNYSPSVEAFKKKADKKGCARLGTMLTSMGQAYGSVFTRIDCDRQYGVELLSQSDMFSAEPQGRIIRRDSMPNPDDHAIRKWQVLIAGAGTLGETEIYGRSIIADGRLEDKYVGPHAMVLTFDSPGEALNLYTYAFLCTRVGISAVRAASYGTKVLGVRADLLRELPIPMPAPGMLERISALIRTTVKKRAEFQVEIDAARQPVLEIQYVREVLRMSEDSKPHSIVWSKELPTLNAWNFCSMGEGLQFLRSKWKLRLRDIVDTPSMSYGPRYSRIPCQAPYGVEFLAQRDVFTIRRVPRRIVDPGIDDRILLSSDNTILLGSCGQLGEGNLFGRAELGMFGSAKCAVTSDTLRLNPKASYVEPLYAFLSTRLGTLLLRSTAVGTSIPRMHPVLLNELPIPEFTTATMAEITRHVKAAADARKAANTAEAEAVRLIEEEILPEWLD